MADGQLNVQPGESSEQFKQRIMAKRSGKTPPEPKPVVEVAKDAPVASAQSTPEKAPEPTVEKDTASSSKAEQAVDQTQVPSDKKEDKPEVDIREWARIKGIKDEDSALRSLRELEQKLTRMAREAKPVQREQNVPRGTMEPQWQPQPQVPVQPSYPPYVDQKAILEAEAARYNLPPEDFERVLKVAVDVSNFTRKQLEAQYQKEIAEIKRETGRTTEFRELMADPLFNDPEVQFEMHKVLEDNPNAFTYEPAPYSWAFNEAQRRIARRYLQERRVESDGSKSGLPSTPPSERSRGNAVPGPNDNHEKTLMDKFLKAGSAKEKRDMLTSIGAINTL